MDDLSSEKTSEHVQWQTSSQESREITRPMTPTLDVNSYEDSIDFTTALLDKYTPALGSSPPATWHPQQSTASISAARASTQPPKRDFSDISGRFYRFSPGNIRGGVGGHQPPQAGSGSPERKKLQTISTPAIIQNDGVLADSVETIKELDPLILPPTLSDSSDEDEGVTLHPDLEIHWNRPTFQRYVVFSVTKTSDSVSLWCKHHTGFTTIELTKSWKNTDIKVNDIIHIVGKFTHSARIVVDHSLLLVVLPDILVPVTTIAEAFKCDRQVILGKSVRSPSANITLPLVYGNIVHEAIQNCLVDVEFSHSRFEDLFNVLVESYLEDLALLDKPVATALDELRLKIPEILRWAGLYTRDKPDFNIPIYRSSKRLNFTIKQSSYTELDIWSPQYGILGKIDAVVQAKTNEGTKLAGFEIKTGKMQTYSHKAQSSLYSLLMRERFGEDACLPYTILYYSNDSSMSAIPSLPEEARVLIQKRNGLVRYIKDPFRLPPPIGNDANLCVRCFSRSSCSTYSSAYQELDFLDNVLPEVRDMVITDTQHLSGSHLEFLEHWDRLITLEGLEVVPGAKNMWCISPTTREQLGIALVGLKVKSLKQVFSDGISKKYVYDLKRAETFPHTRILPGKSIILNTPEHLTIATGYVRSISSTTIELLVNQPLGPESQLSVDLNDNPQFIPYSRGNLFSMFQAEQKRLLELVVNLRTPEFEKIDYAFKGDFNEGQRNAITKVLGCKDYAIIRGMPGTGKTTTIVSIIQVLAKQGKSILLTGYTHSAVDNIILKLTKKGVSVLRLGHSPASMHPDVLEVAACQKSPLNKAELDEIYMTPSVIATTSLSLQNWVLQVRRFDYCIVDEASQLTLPASLGPLTFADKFVLVGDDYQLTPIVMSEQARSEGLDVSLFSYLARAHPEAVVSLTAQYRMNEEIMKLSSELVYNGLLKCATPEVSRQKLKLTKISPFVQCPPWLDINQPVVFANTDTLAENGETQGSEGYYNIQEVRLAANMVNTLVKYGLDPGNIGVISVYNLQVQRLSKEIQSVHPGVEVLTADKAQGRDKECIIISLVRSNKERSVGRLLVDWRRINVVFTRAKCKLIVIGSRETLKSANTLEKFVRVIENHNWIWNAV